jgi:hypothetical protein
MFLVNGSVVVPFGIGLGALYLKVDQFYPFVPKEGQVTKSIRRICMGFRGFIYIVGCFAIWQIYATVIILTIICLWIILQSTSNLLIVKQKKWRMWLLPSQSMKIHKEIDILVKMSCEAYYILLPFLLLFGMMILVVCNVGTIKLHDRVPLLVYLAMPVCSLCVTIGILALFPPAVRIHENSKEFLHSAKLLMMGKYWRRVVKAQRSIRIIFGPLFHAKKSTKATFMAGVIDYTVDFLMI